VSVGIIYISSTNKRPLAHYFLFTQVCKRFLMNIYTCLNKLINTVFFSPFFPQDSLEIGAFGD
jgi:hypothetical protein